MKKAIVTLLYGKKYIDRWRSLCEQNWRSYTERHGYDLICIDRLLDDSPLATSRTIPWQKCLILSHETVKQYDQVVWVDSDILINPNSPCIVSTVPIEKVGAVESFVKLTEDFPSATPEQREVLQDRAIEYWQWQKPFHSAKEYYLVSGFPDTFDQLVQAGVLVLSPQHHRSVLEHIYYNYGETIEPFTGELQPLSYELLKANLVHWIDYRFNRLWAECMLRDYPFLLAPKVEQSRLVRGLRRLKKTMFYASRQEILQLCTTTAFVNNYFLHFAGTAEYMPWVNTNVQAWQALRAKV